PNVRAAALAMTGRCANCRPAILRHQPDAGWKPDGPAPSKQSATARRMSAYVMPLSTAWNSSSVIAASLTSFAAALPTSGPVDNPSASQAQPRAGRDFPPWPGWQQCGNGQGRSPAAVVLRSLPWVGSQE